MLRTWKALLAIIPFGLLLLCLFVSSYGFQAEHKFTIIYTSNVYGALEPCGWKATLGGLARKATYIKQLRDEGKNLLILDSGDMLFSPSFKSYKNPELLIKGADCVIDTLNITGLDTSNIGDNDLVAGKEYILERTHAAKFPFISSNLKYEESGDLLFLPYIIKEVDGLKLGIFGLITNKAKFASGLIADDPFQTAEKVVEELKDNCDLIIALTHLGVYDDRRLAQKVPDINIIVGGHCGTKLSTPLKVGNTIILNDYIQGRYLGQLDLIIRNGSLDFSDATPADNLDNSSAGREANDIQANDHSESNMGKSQYVNALVPMDESISDDPEIKNIVDDYKHYKTEFIRTSFISSKTNGEN